MYGLSWILFAAQIACWTSAGASAGAAADPSGISWATAARHDQVDGIGRRRRGRRLLEGRASGLIGSRRLRHGSGGEDQRQRCAKRKGECPQGEQAVFLFRRPAGLADGLTLKEPASHATCATRPNYLGPPSPGDQPGVRLSAATYRKPRSNVQYNGPHGGWAISYEIGQRYAALGLLAHRRSRAGGLARRYATVTTLAGRAGFLLGGVHCAARRRVWRRGRRAHPAFDASRQRADRRRGARGRPAAGLPGLRHQEHDADRRRRCDRRRGRDRARHVSLAHAGVAPAGGRAGRGARLEDRPRGLGAGEPPDPRADPVRRRRHDPRSDARRARRTSAHRLQGGGRRAGDPGRDQGARSRATRRPTSPPPTRTRWRPPSTGSRPPPPANPRPRSSSPPRSARSSRCPRRHGRRSPATRCCGSAPPACRRRPRPRSRPTRRRRSTCSARRT